jgi:glyoxylase-like metal-dependent hydrolase (beta-lactamase superfamily II)
MDEVIIMKIVKYSLGQLQANCYFLIEDQQCLIIDPADDASFILEELQRQQLNLVGMLATHGHYDHIMAVGEIQQSVDIPLYIHKDDKFLIDRVEQTAEYFLGYKPVVLSINKVENFPTSPRLRWASKLKIIHTPGHTPGSCCFYIKEENAVFTGDTLFKEAVGRTDLSYSSKDDLKKSLKKIFKLPKETIVYSGHGEETLIQDEINLTSPGFL